MAKYAAAVQMDCITGDLKENTEHVIGLLEKMKKEEPELILAVFPEMVLYGYERLYEISQKYGQNEIESCLNRIAQKCKSLQINAVAGAPYYGKKGLENALYYLNTRGKVQHVYSKIHLIEMERSVFVPGDAYGVCSTDFGKAGFLICWDSAFAKTVETYVRAGADFLIVSAAWERAYERQWELAVCGRSFDNDIPIIAANRIGKSGEQELAGHSMITDCMGNTIEVGTAEEEAYLIADLQQILSKEKRKGFGSQTEEQKEEACFQENIRTYAM